MIYVQTAWSGTKGTGRTISLIRGENWSDCANQASKLSYGTLESMSLLEIAVDPWEPTGNVFVCNYNNLEGNNKVVYVIASSLKQANEQVYKLEPSKILSIVKTEITYSVK